MSDDRTMTRKRIRFSWLSLSIAGLGAVLMAVCGLEAFAARLRRKGRPPHQTAVYR